MNRNITYTEKEGYLYPDLELLEQKEDTYRYMGAAKEALP